MSTIQGTTRAQTIFLRSLKTSATGTLEAKWPSPVVLRRWLRKAGFLHAMRSVRAALWYQADFQLLAAATGAASALQATIASGDIEEQTRQLAALGNLIRLAHLRQRFAASSVPEPTNNGLALVKFFRSIHPNAKVKVALDYLERVDGRKLNADDVACEED
jgi:hypothetical protein